MRIRGQCFDTGRELHPQNSFTTVPQKSYRVIFLTYNLLLCAKTSNTANDHFTTSGGFRITVISTKWLQITSSVYPHGDPRDAFGSRRFCSLL